MAKTVLVVDDEPLILEMTAEMLADLGCEVITAANGSEALAKLNDQHIDLLLTDINMPGLGGYELAERGKTCRPSLHVIFLSGRESDGHGFPLIRKPFVEADLTRIMRQATGLC